MARTRSELPTSVEALQALVVELQERVDLLEEWNRLLKSQKFGARSEKISAEQGRLFNEAEVEAETDAEASGEPGSIAVPAHTRDKPRRRPLPDFLPVEEILCPGNTSPAQYSRTRRVKASVELEGIRSPSDFANPRTWLMSWVRARTKPSRAKRRTRSRCASAPR